MKRRSMVRVHKDWAAADDAVVVGMVAGGAQAAEIGVKLNRSRDSVRSRLHVLRYAGEVVKKVREKRQGVPERLVVAWDELTMQQQACMRRRLGPQIFADVGDCADDRTVRG
mgnify:CR=1 FL=1